MMYFKGGDYMLRGYKGLTDYQRQFFNITLKRHQACLGDDLKKEYTPTGVKSLGPRKVKVTFKNGSWLNYTDNGEWY